jgi:hypothetical protein
MLIQALHPIRHPAAACLHEGDFQAWKSFEQPAGNHAQRRNHLLERVRHHMGIEGMIEAVGCRRHAVPRADVDAHRNVQPLRLGKKWKEVRIVQVFFRCRNRRCRHGDEFKFLHGAT